MTSTEASLADALKDLMLAHPEAIHCYYRDIDATLIRENLKLTPVERLRKLEEFVLFITKLREAKRRVGNQHAWVDAFRTTPLSVCQPQD